MNRHDESVFMAGPKPMLTEFGIHQRLEKCEVQSTPLSEYNFEVSKFSVTFLKVLLFLQHLTRSGYQKTAVIGVSVIR